MALLHFGRIYKHCKALNIFVMKVTLDLFYINKLTTVLEIIFVSSFCQNGL